MIYIFSYLISWRRLNLAMSNASAAAISVNSSSLVPRNFRWRPSHVAARPFQRCLHMLGTRLSSAYVLHSGRRQGMLQQAIHTIDFTGHRTGAVTHHTYFAHIHTNFFITVLTVFTTVNALPSGTQVHKCCLADGITGDITRIYNGQCLTVRQTDAVHERCLADRITGDLSSDDSQAFLGRSVR